MIRRILCLLAIAALLAGQTALALQTLKLEIPVRVEAAPSAKPEDSEPAPQMEREGEAEKGEKAAPEESLDVLAEAPARASELVQKSDLEEREVPLAYRWEMERPLAWSLNLRGLAEPEGETPIALVVENRQDAPVWVELVDKTDEETAAFYRALGYEVPESWAERFVLGPGASRAVFRAFTPVSSAAIEPERTREALPALQVHICWEPLSRVDTQIYLDVLTGGNAK